MSYDSFLSCTKLFKTASEKTEGSICSVVTIYYLNLLGGEAILAIHTKNKHLRDHAKTNYQLQW